MKIKPLTLLGLFVTLIGPMTSSLVGQSPLPRTFQQLDQLAPEQRNELRTMYRHDPELVFGVKSLAAPARHSGRPCRWPYTLWTSRSLEH